MHMQNTSATQNVQYLTTHLNCNAICKVLMQMMYELQHLLSGAIKPDEGILGYLGKAPVRDAIRHLLAQEMLVECNCILSISFFTFHFVLSILVKQKYICLFINSTMNTLF